MVHCIMELVHCITELVHCVIALVQCKYICESHAEKNPSLS